MFKGRKSGSKQLANSEISSPTKVTHGLHVDENFEWSGPDAATQFVFGEKLGEGSFGAVFRATHKTSGIDMAIKTIPVLDNDDLGEIEHEIDILKKCSSPNVVSYYGCFKSGRDFWILMDFCVHGSLRDLMDRMEKPLDERVVAHVCQGALAGLAYLHSKNIMHRDIKAANILLDANGTPKLADFGVSRQMTNTWAKTMSLVGTPLWMAPEVAMMKPYTFSADVWSLGITAMELAEFYPPYADSTPMKAMLLITRNPPPKLSGKFTAAFNDFVAKCLCKKPEERPTAAALQRHAFITDSRFKSDLMKPILDFSNRYRNRVNKGVPVPTASPAKSRAGTKRTPPASPPPRAPLASTRRVYDDDEETEESGTVVFRGAAAAAADATTSFNEDGTMVIRRSDATRGAATTTTTTAAAEDATEEESGTVVIKKQAYPVGSFAQLHNTIKRHFTIVSPSAQGSSNGLVSKRDFFFVGVGVLLAIFIRYLLRLGFRL